MARSLKIKTADGNVDTWTEDEFDSFEFTDTNVLLIMNDEKIVTVYNPMFWLTIDATGEEV